MRVGATPASRSMRSIEIVRPILRLRRNRDAGVAPTDRPDLRVINSRGGGANRALTGGCGLRGGGVRVERRTQRREVEEVGEIADDVIGVRTFDGDGRRMAKDR